MWQTFMFSLSLHDALPILRIHSGVLRKGQQVAWCRADGSIQRAKIAELLVTEGLERVPGDEAHPGDIVRSEEHTSELQSRGHIVFRLLLEEKDEVHFVIEG